MKHSFVAGGKRIYTKAIGEQYRTEKKKLQVRLSSTADEAERQQIALQIAQLERDYRKKLQNADRGLF